MCLMLTSGEMHEHFFYVLLITGFHVFIPKLVVYMWYKLLLVAMSQSRMISKICSASKSDTRCNYMSKYT